MSETKKLSSMDASFLYLETPEMPMHVGSMAIFRLPEDYKGNFFEDFKAMIASRLHIAPILKARLQKTPLDIDHPSWVEDDQFDIDRHIFRGSLPAPYDRATLERIVGWMHAKLLNRARPLWEFYVFEGMKDNEIGLYSKMHHACIDGGAGAALTNMIYDVTPVPREVPPPTATRKPEPREVAANFIDSYQQLWRQPFDGSSTPKTLELPRSGKNDLGSILFDNAMFQIENAVKFAGSIPTMLKSVSEVVGKISDPKSRDSIASMASPPTILNKTISSERSFAGTSVSLSRAKALAKKSGGKLNDVVLALSSGVVRRYLLEQGALPAKSMTAAVPISLREEGNTDSNNQVFGMICSIATNVADPKARLEAIIAQSTKSKEMSHPLRALMPQVSNLSMLGAPIMTQILALLYSRSKSVRRAAAGGEYHRVECAGTAANPLCGRCRAAAHLPGVDFDPWSGAEHHRAELSRSARFWLHLRRQYHSARAGSLRYAAGRVRRAGGSLCRTGACETYRSRVRFLR